MYYITVNIYFIYLLTYYASSIIYNIDIVINYNKLYLFIIILMIYYITKSKNICTH